MSMLTFEAERFPRIPSVSPEAEQSDMKTKLIVL